MRPVPDDADQTSERAQRRAARQVVAGYHEQQLLLLLERVRQGFARMDAGEIDAFELDELIHRYKRSAQKLWSFCELTGSQALRTARSLEYWRECGEDPPDWWAAGEPRGRH